MFIKLTTVNENIWINTDSVVSIEEIQLASKKTGSVLCFFVSRTNKVTGNKLVVLETPEEIVKRMSKDFKE